jgi:hypothetical protein
MAGNAGGGLNGQHTLCGHPAPLAPLVDGWRLDPKDVGQGLLAPSSVNCTVKRVFGFHGANIRLVLIFCQQGKPKFLSGSIR